MKWRFVSDAGHTGEFIHMTQNNASPMRTNPLSIRRSWCILDSSAGEPTLSRWAFWVPFRDVLDAEKPQQLRRLYPLWRLQHVAARGQRGVGLI